MIAPKPTKYKGCIYRSRLEATWAAFFDRVGWKYQYEPFDLCGWVPDFILFGFGNDDILVEVKPYSSFNDFVVNKVTKKIALACEDDTRTVLLVGCSVCIDSAYTLDGIPLASIGWFKPKAKAQGYIIASLGSPNVAQVKKIYAESQNLTRWRPPRYDG